MSRIDLQRDRHRVEEILTKLSDLAFLGYLSTDPTTAELDAMTKPEGGKGTIWYNTASNVWKGYNGTAVKTFDWT